MKNNIALLLIAVFGLAAFGQTNKVKGNLSTSDTADLFILNIYPDSFPNISVLFKAETRSGEPLWNLTKEKMAVKENSLNCNVISLEQISDYKPIYIGIVIDHSGSMSIDISQLHDKNGKPLYSYDANFEPILPNGYTAPIDNAKAAVKAFISTFNTQKDFISIVGFSNTVDMQSHLTQDISKINSLIDSMKADSSTALYDAMIKSIEDIEKAEGVKVLVVLTDGHDNSSQSKWYDVVEKALKANIPIYIIGLGDVNINTLKSIARSTKGEFYYTHISNTLNTVYAEISKRVQAFYNLVYTSTNFLSSDSIREIEISFDVDSVFLMSNSETINLPTEVVAFIEQKEKKKEYIFYGGVGFAVLIAAGLLLYYLKSTKENNKQPEIKDVFPNPTNGTININHSSSSGQLQIMNLNGQVATIIDITGGEEKFDLSELPEGNYLALLRSMGKQSNTVKFAIKR
jgi:Ca-activated chloride channel family protein